MPQKDKRSWPLGSKRVQCCLREADVKLSGILLNPVPRLEFREKNNAIFQTYATKPFPTNSWVLNAVCATHTSGYVHTVNHRNTDGTCRQCSLSVAMDSIFVQQDFRCLPCVSRVQEGHAQCNETLPTLKENTVIIHQTLWRALTRCTAHITLLRCKLLCCTNFDTQFPLFLLLCVCFFYLIGRVPRIPLLFRLITFLTLWGMSD